VKISVATAMHFMQSLDQCMLYSHSRGAWFRREPGIDSSGWDAKGGRKGTGRKKGAGNGSGRWEVNWVVSQRKLTSEITGHQKFSLPLSISRDGFDKAGQLTRSCVQRDTSAIIWLPSFIEIYLQRFKIASTHIITCTVYGQTDRLKI